VKDGYDNNLSQDEIAANISNRIGVIKNKRARAIARTEIARTATISDYVINKERGATGFYVECRNTACPVCKNAWHRGWSEESDGSFAPSDTSAGGKGWIGDRIFSMSDTKMLPPIHPNCSCVPYFITENEKPKDAVMVEPTTTKTVVEDKPTSETTTATRQTTTTQPKETNSEYSKLANRYDDITFEETTEEYYIYRNNVDGTSIKFERAVPLSDIQSHLDFYDSLEWVLKRSTREVVFVEEPTENSNNMGLNHHGKMVEIFLGNIKNHEQGKLQGVKFVIAHELFHSVDINSKTSFGGKEFSLKRVWQKAITEDDKNFKAQGITAQYGNVNPIEHSPTAGSNVTYELFFGTERTRAMEDIADSIGVQFMEPNEKIGTDLGMLTKEEWNKTFPNRAKLAQDILKDPLKYGLDNSIMLGAYGETSEKKEAQPKPTSDDNKTQIERINRRIKSYEKSIEKFSKIDKKIAKMYQGRLDKAKKQLSELQGE
jgi:hypothetical protein